MTTANRAMEAVRVVIPATRDEEDAFYIVKEMAGSIDSKVASE